MVKSSETERKERMDTSSLMEQILSSDNLNRAYLQVVRNKGAEGVDGVKYTELKEHLAKNGENIKEQLRARKYKPQPVRRVEIPKPDGGVRNLGVPTVTDRFVQQAIAQVLTPIYEEQFHDHSYGFRPNRGCHEAITEVYQRISYGKISYIVDADIKGFFDHIDHDWMMKFLEWNIQDKNLLWLIRKYLKAGIMEQGKFEPTEEGSAQGSVMSPMLANIYMHHVLTLWFKLVVKKEMQGECFLVNFADDFVAGFQHKSEAERYYKELKERMEKFGLELESSKSRLIEFGRFAEQNRRARGECKPETFDFLGFTFYCSKTRKGGFVPKVQTSRKKFEQKVRAYKNWIYDNRNRPMREIIKELNVKLIGHYRYYGVTWNFRKITTFLHRVQQFLFKAMNRRGCRRAYTWNGFVEMLKYYPLAKPKTYYCLY